MPTNDEGRRVPILRIDDDGTSTYGSAAAHGPDEGDEFRLSDFRDLYDEPLDLPAGSRYELDLDEYEALESEPTLIERLGCLVVLFGAVAFWIFAVLAGIRWMVPR